MMMSAWWILGTYLGVFGVQNWGRSGGRGLRAQAWQKNWGWIKEGLGFLGSEIKLNWGAILRQVEGGGV
jgi:hypothetical protein